MCSARWPVLYALSTAVNALYSPSPLYSAVSALYSRGQPAAVSALYGEGPDGETTGEHSARNALVVLVPQVNIVDTKLSTNTKTGCTLSLACRDISLARNIKPDLRRTLILNNTII